MSLSSPPKPPLWWVDQDPGEGLVEPRRRKDREMVLIASALFASHRGAPPPGRLHWLIAELNDFLYGAGLKARLLMGFSATLATWVSPLLVRRLPPLSRLTASERIEALEALEASTLGTPLFALKAILSLLYYEHPDAAAEVGFDGKSLLEWQP